MWVGSLVIWIECTMLVDDSLMDVMLPFCRTRSTVSSYEDSMWGLLVGLIFTDNGSTGTTG